MTLAGLPVPSYVTQVAEWTARKAKLFEVGVYPDKGVTITREHLARWHDQFDLPVPVLIEHARSPLELGYLTSVEVQDGQLFGTVALTTEADRLIERNGAKSLSLGLTPEMDAIREVSLVRNPRVPSARLFAVSTVCLPGCAWSGDLAVRLSELEARERDRKLRHYVETGRLLPAQVGFAEALMSLEDSVGFADEMVPVGALVARLIESGHPHRLFAETAPTPASAASSMEPDAERYFRRNFPGLSLDEIAKRLHSTRP